MFNHQLKIPISDEDLLFVLKLRLSGVWDMISDDLKTKTETGIGICTEIKFNKALPVTIPLNIEAKKSGDSILVSLNSGARVLSHFEMLLKMKVSDEYQRKQIMARAIRVLWHMCDMADYKYHGDFIMPSFSCKDQGRLELESMIFYRKLQNVFDALCDAFL